MLRNLARALPLAAIALLAMACGGRSQLIVPSVSLDATNTNTDATVQDTALPPCNPDVIVDAGPVVTPTLDLLLMVDNSNSMRDNQLHLLEQFGAMVEALIHGACVSSSNPELHPCTGTDSTEVQRSLPIHDMHVGVVSSDLGTPTASIPGCVASATGDDGLLNPIANGAALAQHEPWTTAPSSFDRPADCTDPNEFPAFITFTSGTTDPMRFDHDFRCNAALYVNGCGLESQLEAMYRALVIHDAHARPGNADPNAGFLRDDALLALIALTDEEDGSVRNCMYANGQPCSDALDVYNAASSRWSSSNLNLRFYMYQPGGAQDPTWPLDRYIDPRNPNVGFPGLKPGHPERVIFAAITGVPLQGWTNSDGTTNWDALLGAPSRVGPDDFVGRDSTTSLHGMAPEGPYSMQQANADPSCAERTVPACHREGSTYVPGACTTDQQYFAWPGRRIVEVARRFDRSTFCHGAPCRNGVVDSICSNNYTRAIASIVRAVGTQFECR